VTGCGSARGNGIGLPVEVTQDLVCPSCGQALAVVQEVGRPGDTSGAFQCSGCRARFAVHDSVPCFVGNLEEQTQTARGFGFEWKAFWRGCFDRGDVFGLSFTDTARYFLSSLGVTEAGLRGAKVLDAGTGSGRIPISLGHAGCRIYAVDIHESLALVALAARDVDNAYFFRADLLNLPFRNDCFDIAWSSGVIHHTPDAARALASLARKVKPGGRLFVSVYGKDLHPYVRMRHALPFVRRLPVSVVFGIALLMAGPLYVAFNGALFLSRALRRDGRAPRRLLGFLLSDTRYRSFGRILLNIFDELHPRYHSEHTVEEVQAWFHANGFGDTVVTESGRGMVGVRGIKTTAAGGTGRGPVSR
jgi:SAM-dependent methyltransferase